MVERIDFSVTIADTEYQCWRIVAGERKLTQRIYVEGYGSKRDSADYGPGRHRPESMAGVAYLIASEIIARPPR